MRLKPQGRRGEVLDEFYFVEFRIDPTDEFYFAKMWSSPASQAATQAAITAIRIHAGP